MAERAADAAEAGASGNLSGWTARSWPGDSPLEGRLVSILPLRTEDHADALWSAFGGSDNPALWAYLPDGPFADLAGFTDWLRKVETRPDWVAFAIQPHAAGAPCGIASYMRIDVVNGVAEIGCVALGKGLARTAAATEAMALFAGRIFDELGYRRYEWKCNSLNAPSRAAARRLGFVEEGTFRHHMVVKGRNRDTTWFAMTDREWPARREAFRRWLDPDNFDDAGRQRRSLAALREGG